MHILFFFLCLCQIIIYKMKTQIEKFTALLGCGLKEAELPIFIDPKYYDIYCDKNFITEFQPFVLHVFEAQFQKFENIGDKEVKRIYDFTHDVFLLIEIKCGYVTSININSLLRVFDNPNLKFKLSVTSLYTNKSTASLFILID